MLKALSLVEIELARGNCGECFQEELASEFADKMQFPAQVCKFSSKAASDIIFLNFVKALEAEFHRDEPEQEPWKAGMK